MRNYGQAVVAGVSGTITYVTPGLNVSGAKILPTGITANHQWDQGTIIRDPVTGKQIGRIINDESYLVTIDWIPSADRAIANTKANAKKCFEYLPPHTLVQISGADDSELNKTFLYESGAERTFTPTGEVKWRMPIRRLLELDDAGHTLLSTEILA